MGQAATLVVPDVLGADVLAPSRAVVTQAAAKDATLSQRLGELRAAVSAAPSAEQQGLVAQAAQVLTTPPAPSSGWKASRRTGRSRRSSG